MDLTAIGSGIDLADNLVKLISPSVTQEQKESLLDAFKSRISEIQAAGDAVAANPSDRGAQLALGDLHRRLLNAAGYAAPGVASINVSVPLDDDLQLLTAVALVVLLAEQGQQQVKS
jgi:two-component sensor histidine kinase